MRHLNSNGFGLIGLIIVVFVALILIFGYQFFGKDQQKNQIESGNEAIKQAEDAAEAQNQGSIYLQNQIVDPPAVNYHGIQNDLKDIKP